MINLCQAISLERIHKVVSAFVDCIHFNNKYINILIHLCFYSLYSPRDFFFFFFFVCLFSGGGGGVMGVTFLPVILSCIAYRSLVLYVFGV